MPIIRIPMNATSQNHARGSVEIRYEKMTPDDGIIVFKGYNKRFRYEECFDRLAFYDEVSINYYDNSGKFINQNELEHAKIFVENGEHIILYGKEAAQLESIIDHVYRDYFYKEYAARWKVNILMFDALFNDLSLELLDTFLNTPIKHSRFDYRYKFDFSFIDDMYFTPLHCAAYLGDVGELTAFVEKGGKLDIKAVSVIDQAQYDIAELAIKGNKPTATAIINYYFKTQQPIYQQDEINRLLFQCIKSRNAEAATVILQYGAQVNCVDKNASSPLQCAIVNRDIDMAQSLIAAGADVNAKFTNGMTLLQYTVNDGNVSLTALLINANADVHCLSKDGDTLLHYACSYLVRHIKFISTDIYRDREISPSNLLASGFQVDNNYRYNEKPFPVFASVIAEKLFKLLLTNQVAVIMESKLLHQACSNAEAEYDYYSRSGFEKHGKDWFYILRDDSKCDTSSLIKDKAISDLMYKMVQANSAKQEYVNNDGQTAVPSSGGMFKVTNTTEQASQELVVSRQNLY